MLRQGNVVLSHIGEHLLGGVLSSQDIPGHDLEITKSLLTRDVISGRHASLKVRLRHKIHHVRSVVAINSANMACFSNSETNGLVVLIIVIMYHVMEDSVFTTFIHLPQTCQNIDGIFRFFRMRTHQSFSILNKINVKRNNVSIACINIPH